MKLGLLIQNTSVGMGLPITFNGDNQWEGKTGDVRDYIKFFSSRSELNNNGRHNSLSFDESNGYVIFLKFIGELGHFICVVKLRPQDSGRPNDNTAAWIFVPGKLKLLGDEAVKLIDVVKEALSGRNEIDTDTLRHEFAHEYPDPDPVCNFIPATNSIKSSGSSPAAIYYGTGTTYTLPELLGDYLAQSIYGNYSAVFLINNDKESKFEFSGDTIPLSLKKTCIIKAPKECRGFKPYLDNGVTPFTSPVERIEGTLLNIVWKKSGYKDIQKKYTVSFVDNNIAPSEFDFRDNEIEIGVYRSWFKVYDKDSGDPIEECRIVIKDKTLGAPSEDVVYVKETVFNSGVNITISADGYKQDVKKDVQLKKVERANKFPLEHETYHYEFSLPLYIGELKEFSIDSKTKIQESPIRGYNLSRHIYEGKGRFNELDYANDNIKTTIKHFAYGFLTCLLIFVLYGVVATWDDWEMKLAWPPFGLVESEPIATDTVPVVDYSDSIHALNYLDNNITWNKDSLESHPYLQGLWDDMNNFNLEALQGNWESKLSGSMNFNKVSIAAKKCFDKKWDPTATKPNGKYNLRDNDKNINVEKYIKWLSEEHKQKVQAAPASSTKAAPAPTPKAAPAPNPKVAPNKSTNGGSANTSKPTETKKDKGRANDGKAVKKSNDNKQVKK
jgi:hypothetical protein